MVSRATDGYDTPEGKAAKARMTEIRQKNPSGAPMEKWSGAAFVVMSRIITYADLDPSDRTILETVVATAPAEALLSSMMMMMEAQDMANAKKAADSEGPLDPFI